MTFDEILEDPKYQAEFDKRVAKALETSHAKWEEDLEAKRKEMEENAKLSAEEKAKKEIEKLMKENETYKANEARRLMKDNSLEYIKTKGYSSSIENLVDLGSFKDEAEMQERIDKINTDLSTAISNGLNDKLKQSGFKDLGSLDNKGKADDFNFNFSSIKNN